MFESIFSLSTFVALLLGDKSCEPAPPAKNLTHFFFRLKQRSLWLLMMMWHFYKAHYPYYYTLMCYLALCMDIKLSTLIEICRCPQCWKFWKQGQTMKAGTTFHTLYKMCMGSWTFPAYQYRDNVWYRVYCPYQKIREL